MFISIRLFDQDNSIKYTDAIRDIFLVSHSEIFQIFKLPLQLFVFLENSVLFSGCRIFIGTLLQTKSKFKNIDNKIVLFQEQQTIYQVSSIQKNR